MENRITLRLIDNTWHAVFSGPHSADIRRVFGTDTIPTPFDWRLLAGEVRPVIERLNPGVAVEVAC